MDRKRVGKILTTEAGELAWAAFKDLKRLTGENLCETSEWYRVGFDSEYNSSTDTLISYQLYGETGDYRFISGPSRKSLHDIVRTAAQLRNASKKILIISFFDTAELSQLSEQFWQVPDLQFYQVHPRGIFHVKGQVDGTEFFFYDIWHFFASMRESSNLYSVADRFGFRKIHYEVTNLSLEVCNDPNFREYGINDAKLCVDLFKVLEHTYMDVNGISIIGRDTPAAAAMASFRKNYLTVDVKRSPLYVRRLALDSDWAGRVECGFIGEKENVFEHDADSLYPRSALLLGDLPSANDWVQGIPENLENVEGFIEVQFAFPPYEEWPCLPVYEKSCLYFPLQGRSVCSIGEVRAALTRGCKILRIYRCCYYRNGSHGEFTSFVNDNIRLKELAEDNPALRAVAKLNMNSCIGKFIQNKGGVEYSEISKYIATHLHDFTPNDVNRLFSGSLILPDVSYSHSVNIGSGFYPEWHSLILGKSREIMAYAIYNSFAYPNILMISTDALDVASSNLGPTMVKFNLKAGPGIFKSIRGRLHILYDEKDGKILHLAKHALPIPDEEAAMAILLSQHKEQVTFRTNAHKTLREAAQTGTSLFSDKAKVFSFNFNPDRKRVLADNGFTHPLKMVA